MIIKKKRRSPIKTAFVTFLIVSLAFFCTLFALNLDVVSSYFGKNPCVSDTSMRNPYQGSWNNKVDANNPALSESFLDYVDDTIFIGDSRTCGLATYRFIKQKNVYAVVGQSHIGARSEHFVNLGTGYLLTVAQAVAIKKPERMIVSYGINGVSFMGEDSFMSEYSALIDELKSASPNSLLIIQSILPVSSYYEICTDPRLTNHKIDNYNAKLKQLALEKDCRFLDISSLLKDNQNCLSSIYDSGDGLHFNIHAYEVILQYIDQNRII
ncbi:MAG: GDSL-type esterase/lipase family protein [Oscillospiraceae bacterium]|nr:GDSL-type esterase/lipase family protein [Oscillospiraceae bacterium]MDD3832789.1 GDSL-type esterase/lipase family protein [Oscillospiraceae bacterium]